MTDEMAKQIAKKIRRAVDRGTGFRLTADEVNSWLATSFLVEWADAVLDGTYTEKGASDVTAQG